MGTSFGRTLIIGAAIVIVVFGLRLASGFLGPMLLGIFATILLIPVVDALSRRGWPRWAGVTVGVGLYAVAVLLVVLAGVLAVRELEDFRPELEAAVADNPTLAGSLTPEAVRDVAADIVETITGAGIALGIAGLVLIYGLTAAHRLPEIARHAFRARTAPLEAWTRFSDGFRTFFGARIVLAALMSGGAGAILILLGQGMVGLWILVAFLFSFIPNIGLILSMLGPALVALVLDGWQTALLVVIGYSAVNIAVDYVIQPRFMARELNLSPLVTIISLFAWAAVLGWVGALFAIPLTLALQIALGHFDDSRWLADLMLDHPPTRMGEEVVAEGGFEPPTKGL